MQLKLKGIVVHEQDTGEQDKYLKILTDTCGLLLVKAIGVKKISAKNSRSSQLFAYSEIILNEKNGYYTLQESSLVTNFYSIREDVVAYALSCYLCELCSIVSVGGEEGNEILRLLLNSLYACEKKINEYAIIKAVFEFRLAALIGYEPDLYECPYCGRPGGEIEDKIFNLTDGYLCCKDCEEDEGSYSKKYSISHNTFLAFLHILSNPVNKVFLFKLDSRSQAELEKIAEEYLLIRLDQNIKTLDFYKQTINLGQ